MLLLCLWVAANAVAATQASTSIPDVTSFTRRSKGSSLQENDQGTPPTLHIFIYETNQEKDSPAAILLEQANSLPGVQAVVFGQGSRFEGYASKYNAVRPLLDATNPEELVIITDGRDVLINAEYGVVSETSVPKFVEAYDGITSSFPGAVVISAEAQCCVSALTHVTPGGYFHADGSRKDRSCTSGAADCMWNGDDQAIPWETFMKTLAIDRVGETYDDVYLNAGLMAGTAGDLAELFDQLQMENTEDDQAVLTDFMHLHPDRIVLDYKQSLFGNNRGGLGGMEEDTCMFFNDGNQLVHSKTHTSPLFVHSPGGYVQCHDELASQLGLPQVSKTTRRRLATRKCKNYKNCAVGSSEDPVTANGIGGGSSNFENWAQTFGG